MAARKTSPPVPARGERGAAPLESAALRLAKLGLDLARDLRTASLWLLGPVDRLLRHMRGQAGLPPLWLRRHVGPVRDFEQAARDMEAIVRQLQLVEGSSRILEIGCGCGAMVPALARMLGPGGRYVGFDVHGPSIRWCRQRFADEPRLRFDLAEIASPYGNPSWRRAVEAYTFPMADRGADFILAKSVFTHLLEMEARRYLDEIRRTLSPGGRALITAFLFNRASRPPAFPWPEADSAVRWLRRLRVPAAVAFDRAFFEGIIEEAGLTVSSMIAGYWPGIAAIPEGQDILVLSLASRS